MAAHYQIDRKSCLSTTLRFQTARELHTEHIPQGGQNLSHLFCHCISHLANSTQSNKGHTHKVAKVEVNKKKKTIYVKVVCNKLHSQKEVLQSVSLLCFL